jgi:type I restriction enzyme M protein
VPNGVLFGSSNAHVRGRQLLLEKSDLQAVISMPSGVFQPYAGVGTAVLVFVKGGKTEKVWFYDMKADGYSLDQKRDFIDGKGDIPDILEKFKHGRAESSQSIAVEFEEIRKNDYNLSISRYRQVEHEEVVHENPEVLIEDITRLEQEITRELQELKGLI